MQLALLILVGYFLGSIKGESCYLNFTTLNMLENRTTNHSALRTGYWVSDRYLANGWYDVGSRNMPTDSSKLTFNNSCGTNYPIWMNGTIPQTSEGKVTRTACIFSDSSACGLSLEIEVINCGTHMLYKLSGLNPFYTSTSDNDKYIYGAYCFEKSHLLPVSVKVQPLLSFADENSVKKPRLVFRCQNIGNMTDDLYYSVSWYVDEHFLLSRGPVLISNLDDTNLNEKDLIQKGHKLDINIKCIVNTSNSTGGSMENTTSESLPFWLGIRVLNPSVQIVQGQTATIKLQPTFPIGCSSNAAKQNPRAQCLLSVDMFDPDDSNNCGGSSISAQNSQSCGGQILGFYHHQWTEGARYDNVTEMKITTKDGTDYKPGRNRFSLKLRVGGTGLNDIVHGNYLKNVTVTPTYEKTWQAKECYSYVDPHMKSFDGRRYENQNLGVFVMYRHISSKQEVQMKTKKCNNFATCACAVAVRAGGDIFLIDLCGSPGLIKYASCKENILDVRQITAYYYQIHMPLGTMTSVTIINSPGFESTLNLIIYPSVKDMNETQGLCGMLNDNQTDDFTTPSGGIETDNNVFSISWRISNESSYFHPQNQNPDLSQLWDQSSLFCVCVAVSNSTTPTSIAPEDQFITQCSASVSSSCAKNHDILGTPYHTCNIRTKRSEQSMSREIERILSKRIMGSDVIVPNTVKRSTLNITFEEALDECTRFFSGNCTTSSFESSLPNSNQDSKNSSITNCALDYTYTGNMSLASLHCETYRSEVDQEIRRNSTFREENPQVVESFRAKTCINNCNNHGDCVNGSCICHEQYIEEDCSVSLRDYPVVEDTYAGGLCQQNMEVCCGEIPIYGSRFVKGTTKQSLQGFQIYINGSIVLEGATAVDNLTIINPFEAAINVPCGSRQRRATNNNNSTMPFITGTKVSLTNDGTNYGPTQIYYIYDSTCQGVLTSTDGYSFYLLAGTCYIGAACYREGESYTSDGCRKCLPSRDPYSWSDGCTSGITDSTSTIIIIVCVVVPVIVVVIAAIIIFKCVQKKKRIAGHFDGNATVTMVEKIKLDQR
ncbi:hypothetical protein ACJMK2_017724 [Sinanodonta woodiana]|uniref:VWFD domain-containing protein n=1 Tax=Sinanodonta woodiana TaxID=1069815 RepID=A0ABD3UCS1_SINWO